MSPILSIRNLEWEKAPGQPVFSNVNFTLEEGDFLVLTGKSGSGQVVHCFHLLSGKQLNNP